MKNIENNTVNILMPHRINFTSLTWVLRSQKRKNNMANITFFLLCH